MINKKNVLNYILFTNTNYNIFFAPCVFKLNKLHLIFYFLKNINLYYHIYLFGRLKYLGKTYRLKRKKKYLDCKLSKSHITKIYINRLKFKLLKRKKNLYIYKFINNNSFNLFKIKIKNLRYINKYTKRGLRIGRTKFNKRFGKISQAFTGLH